jgi:hypothetical protein
MNVLPISAALEPRVPEPRTTDFVIPITVGMEKKRNSFAGQNDKSSRKAA